MSKFPYKDELIGCWIYDNIPDTMTRAKVSDIKIGTLVLYRGELGSWKDLFIATKIKQSNFTTAQSCIKRGLDFYVKKSGV